jgi:hypothetical protein
VRRARARLALRRGALHERRLQNEALRAAGRPELDRWFTGRHGTTVLHGPFAGLRYAPGAIDRVHHLTAKLLGAYEAELAEVVAAQIERRPPRFVDIGAADGYYAVGMATACPAIDVHAYEIDPVARRVLRANARENGVRLTVHGPANSRRLAEHDLDGAFVLSDCEGAEVDILAAEAIPALARATLLVELHGDTGAPLRERFAPSHAVREIQSSPRDPAAFPELDDAPGDLRAGAVDEMRPGAMSWLLLEPRLKPSAQPVSSGLRHSRSHLEGWRDMALRNPGNHPHSGNGAKSIRLPKTTA